MRPDGKARRARIPGVFERGATPPAGMQRRPNAAGISPRAVKRGVCYNGRCFQRMNKTVFVAVAAGAVLGIAVPARAELVVFTAGRSISAQGHRDEGSAVALVLRAGGELVCEPAAVARCR